MLNIFGLSLAAWSVTFTIGNALTGLPFCRYAALVAAFLSAVLMLVSAITNERPLVPTVIAQRSGSGITKD